MLFGKRLEVNFSKDPNITQGADTHEYVNSILNRFNRNAAKNYKYCCSPTKMIHLPTLPQDITEEEIVSLLEEHGTVVNSRLFEMNGRLTRRNAMYNSCHVQLLQVTAHVHQFKAITV
ncbi:hypothetical protein JCGZ_15175 [Jatropha curcas]|uniref:RRM domain-containing protein n=1 Tax=Jatropha curcas TaxID=180498 RepID=A0A067K3H2_JATCU|nr:hypothetical protein JCGZ_15175 [Jatropha curcas]